MPPSRRFLRRRSSTKLSAVLAAALAAAAFGTGISDAAPRVPAAASPLAAQPDSLFPATAPGSIDYLGTPIPADPVRDPNEEAILTTSNLTVNKPRFTGPQWQIPIYTATAADPVYTPKLTKTKSWRCGLEGGTMRIPDGATRELPGKGDGWIAVHDVTNNRVDAIWRASKSSTNWSGTCGGSYRADGNGFGFSYPGSQVDKITGVGTGSESQVGAGLILNSEVARREVNHALYLTSTKTCRTPREPAAKSDGSGTGTDCWPMGARVQLDPAVDCAALPAGPTTGEATIGEAMVCRTLQIYGGYVLDSGGSGPLSGIAPAGDDLTDPARSAWTQPGNGMRGAKECAPVSATCGVLANIGFVGTADDLAHIPWDRLRVLAKWDGR